MSQDEFQALLQFMKVLADENRLKLLGILANGERSVEELAALLKLKAPTVSHHLAKLREMDLVGMRSEGNTHYYWLNGDALRQTNKLLLTPEKMASLVDDVEGDAWERKVLRDFFDGIRLKEIPASLKKRAIILKWFANQFEYGVYYKEKQVNEIIQRHHEDSAFIRRELINRLGYMQRDNGTYWRVSPELLDREKRLEVLHQLVDLFEPLHVYNEPEINELIRTKSPDYPFLRRELVAEEMLHSDASGYWRN
jgi:predicted transcriptional regulator